MRPEIAWPADVQAVLDKALERDVALRYRTASEFGRDLQRTVDRMPESKAAEMGTQMVDVPPTRVRPPDTPRTSVSPGVPVVGAGGAIAVPAPGASSAPVTQAAAPRRKMFNVAAVAGIAVVITAGAFAVKTFLGGTADPPVSADTLKKTTPETTTSPPISGVPSQAGSSTARVDSQVSPPATSNSTTPNPGAVTKSVADQLRALIRESTDRSKATSVLTRLDKLERQAAGSEELYLAALVRSQVLAAKLDTVAACEVLKKVRPKLGPEDQNRADQRINITLSCPY